MIQIEEPGAAGDIAALLGVTRQRVQQLSHEPGFPEPVFTTSAGGVWDLVDVRAWAAATGRELPG